jgi:hypothetical protein
MTVAAVSAAISVVSAVAGAISGADLDQTYAKLNQKSSKVGADTKNEARAWANFNVAAQNQLKRFVQSTNNTRRLDAGGESLGTTLVNYRRQKDQLTRGNFEDSIRAAEQAGSQAAAAATAGISGSVADNINSATILRNDRLAMEAEKQGRALDADYQHTAKAITTDAINGLDNRSVYDNFDNNIDVALKYAAPTWFGKFLSGGGLSTLVKAGQTYATGSARGGGMGGTGTAGNIFEFNSGVGGFTDIGTYG